jgi:hypothetical protein
MIERYKSHVEEEKGIMPPISARFSNAVWGAIFAGVAMILVIQLGLALLGSGIGLTAINPGEGNLRAIGIGALIWWMISGLIAFYVGGWTAGRLAGIPRQGDGVLHGLLTWAVTTLLMFLFLTTTIGAIIGGGFGLLKSGGQAISKVAPQVAPQIGAAGGALPSAGNLPAGDEINTIRTEVHQLLQQGGNASAMAEAQIMGAVGILASQPPENQENQKQQVVTMLMNNTNLTPEQARADVDRWAQSAQFVKEDMRQGMENIGGKVQNAAETASNAAGKGALASFVMLALCGFVAGIGGSVGAPHWSEEEVA